MSPPWLRWSVPLVLLCLLTPIPSPGEEARKGRAKILKRLTALPGGVLLRSDAAGAYERMRAAARLEGIWLWANSGYRTRQEQYRLYQRYLRGKGPRAARPGRSNHQLGIAVDVYVGGLASRTYGWLAAHACRHGFRRTVPSEPWHWEYRPRTTRPPAEDRDCLGRPLPASPGPRPGGLVTGR
jgi:D-alanyl-D-alanine carboxypeptidase